MTKKNSSASAHYSLSDKEKLSLYKKSQQFDIPTSVLEEVYMRGYSQWNENSALTPQQHAFNRVNSFVSGGFALSEDRDLIANKSVLKKQIKKIVKEKTNV